MKTYKAMAILYHGFVHYFWWEIEIPIIVNRGGFIRTVFDYYIYSDGRSPQYEEEYFLYEFI